MGFDVITLMGHRNIQMVTPALTAYTVPIGNAVEGGNNVLNLTFAPEPGGSDAALAAARLGREEQGGREECRGEVQPDDQIVQARAQGGAAHGAPPRSRLYSGPKNCSAPWARA